MTFEEVREVIAMRVQQTSGYHDPDTGYRLWVSTDRLTKVKLWANGRLTVSSRRTVRDRWGTPMSMREEV